MLVSINVHMQVSRGFSLGRTLFVGNGLPGRNVFGTNLVSELRQKMRTNRIGQERCLTRRKLASAHKRGEKIAMFESFKGTTDQNINP